MALISVSANPPTTAAVSCVEVEQRLAAAQKALVSCSETSRTVTAAREQCADELEAARDKSSASASQVEACVQAKEQQCHEAASFAASLLNNRARVVNGCVPEKAVTDLQTMLDGWASVSRVLAQLDDYSTGVSDNVPHVTGQTEAERRLSHLLGGRRGGPLWNRRLLIEAFMLTAPETWRRLKGQGAVAIDNLFESRGPLPQDFINEAQGDHTEPAGPAGPPRTAALKLTVSYLQLADCEQHPESAECGRARQLVELLDNTGPLIVRRRVEEMWATPCAAIAPDTVKAWLQDFPSSRKEIGRKTLGELSAGARSKLFHCYLADVEGESAYRRWLMPRLPAPDALDVRTLGLVDELRGLTHDQDPLDLCGRAVRALQRLKASDTCKLEGPETLAAISAWARVPPQTEPRAELQLCSQVATLMWRGSEVILPQSPADPVRVDDTNPQTAMEQVRTACDERRGPDEKFEQQLQVLAAIARALGEQESASPWRLAPGPLRRPAERAHFEEAQTYGAWLQHLVNQESSCDALGLLTERCVACREQETPTYDCALKGELEQTWLRYRRLSITAAFAVAAALLALTWASRLRRARRTFLGPMRTAREHLEGLGLASEPDGWRLLLPSRHDTLSVTLPHSPEWERWGTRACAVLSPGVAALREADVNHAAGVALREDVRVVFLLHHDSAVPDLGAVRATLDWAARGGSRAVQVLPFALSRLAWATREEDLLDLVESTTLRGNPFDLRGPVRSSSQFWSRERLVAGLLTQARTGNWVVVTGLRRFGKSSLALEVARRTTGPSAYVDLAGFHHEVSLGATPATAVEAILRTLTLRLVVSAKERYPASEVPPVPEGPLDAPTLAGWLLGLATACGASSGTPPPPILLVLDEVEQLLSAAPENLSRALDVLSTLVGRLRSAIADPSSPHASSTVSVVMCAAMHPLLWAPLQTLGGQSVMGAFPSVCVPALDVDAAHAMMQGLGARQGIRFEEDALAMLVRESHAVPLLLRQLGTSVLELYDADRARQGVLGAVRVGIEGATEAVRREERGGSPLRVWVESEIAGVDTAAGVMLRALANDTKVTTVALERLVESQVLERFNASGLQAHLGPTELKRRAQEAASVMVRLLAESHLLEAHGDMTSPESYSLPEGVLRRILRAARPTGAPPV